MKKQSNFSASSTRASNTLSLTRFASQLQREKTPFHPIYTASHIVSTAAELKHTAQYTADAVRPISNSTVDDLHLFDFESKVDVFALLPDAHPVVFLRNQLVMCRPYGLQFDGVGALTKLPADSMGFDQQYDIEQDCLNYHERYKRVSIEFNSYQTFEFIGALSFSVSNATDSKLLESSNDSFAFAIQPTPKKITLYTTVEEVPVLVVSQNAKYDKVFFDAGNNFSRYLNFLFESPDLRGDTDLAESAATSLFNCGLFEFDKNTVQFLNPGVTNFKELIKSYVSKIQNFEQAPQLSFYFLQQDDKSYLFFGEVIDQLIDPDFQDAIKFEAPIELKPLLQHYVDQSVYHIHENVFAVMTHSYFRVKDQVWSENVTVVHGENMVDILQAIRHEDMSDQFMHYLQKNNVQSCFYVQRDNQADLEFTGKLIGFASNRKFLDHEEQGESKANTPNARWTVLSMYQTKGGSYVCHQCKYSSIEGERTINEAVVTKVASEVTDFYGYRWLAKKLYESAKFNANEVID